MRLTPSDIQEYRERGFLFFPSLLAPVEIAVLTRALEGIVEHKRPEIVTEKDGTTLRSVFNMQAYDEAFCRLVRHPKILGPVLDLLGEPAYVFQMVLNFKAEFAGDEWPWHQDYPTYHSDDGMPAPRVVNTLIFVEEVNEFNAPLMLIPGSHTLEFPLPEVNTTQTTYPARWLPVEHVGPVARARGIEAPKGPAGSVIFAHTNIIHGSGRNYSPWRRALISLTINALSNATQTSHRPPHIVPPDRTPLDPLGEDCLLALA